MSLVCECGSRGPFTNLGHGYDQQWWVHTTCGKPSSAWFAAQGDDMLNFFRGGPLDGTAYTTSTLLDGSAGGPGWTAELYEYKWTPEVIVSEKTGASARVWVHKSQIPANPVPQPVATDQAVAGQSSPVLNEEGATMAKKNETLEDRRKAGGFSRAQVADASGLTVSVIYRVEKGESKKTTEEEVAAVEAGLQKLEAGTASDTPE